MTTALITMAYKDTFFLPLWIGYYSQFVPKKQIYVLIHGRDPELEAIAEGCNVITITRPEITAHFEVDRWLMLSHFASGLTFQYDTVMYLDTDEIVFCDPERGNDPLAFIDTIDAPVITPHGYEVMHRTDLEPDPIDPSRPLLAQRGFVRINTAYSKPCIIRTPVRWCSGGHASTHDRIHIVPDLYQFHLRFLDAWMYIEKMQARREQTRDPKTGENIPGLGGANWNVSGDLASLVMRKVLDWPIAEVNSLSGQRPFKRIQKNFGYKRRNGYYFFPYIIKKKLFPIPERFRHIF